MANCSCPQKFTLILSLVFFFIAFLTFTLGYIVPTIRFSEYDLRLCLCVSSTVEEHTVSSYSGIVNFKYQTITKLITVIDGLSQLATANYLNVNYPTGTSVPCYVSTNDIQITMFSNNISIIIGSLSIALSVLFLIVFLIITVKQRKRLAYVELDEKK